MSLRNVKLRTKIAVLLASLLALSLAFNIAWSSHLQEAQAQKEILEKSQILAKELSAVWEFMDENQELIDTDADGSHNFKGLSCAVAGKQISRNLSAETDYVIKYTNFTTRKEVDSPDAFEHAALESFQRDNTLAEYYEFKAGEQIFRYSAPLWIKESCLDCHGDPMGELDALGYPKEGMKEGDLAGIISIQMPVDLYMSGIQGNIAQQALYMFAAILFVGVIAYLAIARLITNPLNGLERAARQLEYGNFDVDLSGFAGQGEIKSLANSFDSMAKQLRGLYEDLENQVQTRTTQLVEINETLEHQREQLEEANVILERENTFKSDFLAIMSHELRTPLTAILAYIDLWESSHSDTSEQEKATVTEIKENGVILLSMVNNILEMARAEAGRTELLSEPLDMVDLVNIVEGTVAPLAEKKNILLSTAVSLDVPIIYADREKVRRMVENLASNAIKFTLEGGRVSIQVDADQENKLLKIAVADNGVGIRQKDITVVFDRFRQGSPSLKREYGGSGLGLAVAKELAEAHGGCISVTSTFGEGSVFMIELPFGCGNWEEIQ